MIFSFVLVFAHLQAVLVPIILAIKSIKKFQQINIPELIPYAFTSIGIASIFEMIDHTNTNWIYIDHASIYNWLFYSFLSFGLSCFTNSVSKSKNLIITNLLLVLAASSSYLLFGKSVSLIFQVLISILLLFEWWKRFRDWVFVIYPLTGIFMTTFFGVILSNTNEQIWHIFIGPSGSISLFVLYIVLIRSERKEIFVPYS